MTSTAVDQGAAPSTSPRLLRFCTYHLSTLVQLGPGVSLAIRRALDAERTVDG